MLSSAILTDAVMSEDLNEPIPQLDFAAGQLEAAARGETALHYLLVALGALRFATHDLGTRDDAGRLRRPTGSIGRFVMLWPCVRPLIERCYPADADVISRLCTSVLCLVALSDHPDRLILRAGSDGSIEAWFDDLCLLLNGLDTLYRHLRAEQRAIACGATVREQCAPVGASLH